jgi:hypothetical protein
VAKDSKWHLSGPGFDSQREQISRLELKKSPCCALPALELWCHVFHPPALGGVAEWAVDADPLVMGGQGSGIFSTGTSGSATSYNTVSEGGYSLPS